MPSIRNSVRAASRATTNASRLRSHAAPYAQLNLARHFQSSATIFAAESKKDDLMDKDSMQTTSTEYAKTGSDDGAAQEDAAFDPQKTRPDEELDSAEQESGNTSSSINVSPANQASSQTRDPQEGGAGGSKSETSDQNANRSRHSSEGSPKKSGDKQHGSGGLQ